MAQRFTVPVSVDELHRARALGKKLFGDRMNLFYDAGLWHFGRFLDNLPPISGKGPDKMAPHRRPQMVYAVAPTLSECITTMEGSGKVYSIAGVAPTATRGWRVRFDKNGRVRGYQSPAGIFSREFPGTPGQWS